MLCASTSAGRPIALDDLGHREGLAGAGDAEQNLVLLAVAHAAHEFVDRGGLIALGTVVDRQVKSHLFSIGWSVGRLPRADLQLACAWRMPARSSATEVPPTAGAVRGLCPGSLSICRSRRSAYTGRRCRFLCNRGIPRFPRTPSTFADADPFGPLSLLVYPTCGDITNSVIFETMLMEELFATGIMTMGPSRVDPGRQVGVFAPGVVEAALAARTAEAGRFRWIAGKWSFENSVPATRISPACTDIGIQTLAVSDTDGGVSMVLADGSSHRCLMFDPFSKQWIYVLMRGSFGMLRSKAGWRGDEITFTGLMTMIGVECEWRMTWTRISDEKFQFTNEEKNADGSWVYIDEWRFKRIHD